MPAPAVRSALVAYINVVVIKRSVVYQRTTYIGDFSLYFIHLCKKNKHPRRCFIYKFIKGDFVEEISFSSPNGFIRDLRRSSHYICGS